MRQRGTIEDYHRIAAVAGQQVRWVLPRGSV
jgi:hypothetical protein